MKGNVFAQTSVESKFQFDGNGDLVKTSFLSLDLLTMAMVLGISEGKTWNSIYADTKGTSDEFNDGNIYEFMRSMAEQNWKILDRLIDVQEQIAVIKADYTGMETRMYDHIQDVADQQTREIKGVAASLDDNEIASLSADDKLLYQQSLEQATVFNVSWDIQRVLTREENLISNVANLIESIQYGTVVSYDYSNEVCPWQNMFTV